MNNPSYVAKLNQYHRLKIARGVSINSSAVKNITITWDELKKQLSQTVRTTELFTDYIELGKTKQGRQRQNNIKDVGFIVAGHMAKGKRKKANINSLSLIMLDLDDAPVDTEDQLKSRLGDINFFAYSTHKHCPEAPRVRIVIPLLREVTVEEHEPISRALANKLDMAWVDPTTHQASRAMHYPSTSSDGAFFTFENNCVGWADPDAILADYNDWRDIREWPTGPNENKDVRLKAKEAEDPLTKKGIVGAFCRAYTVHEAIEEFIPSVYDATINGRYSYAAGSTANGVVTYKDKFLYSHHSTDPCADILVNAFDLVRIHLFGHKDANCSDEISPTRRPSYKALREQIKSDPRVRSELLEEQLPNFEASDDEFDTDETLESVELVDLSKKTTALEAKRALKKELTTNEFGKLEATLGNIISILEHDPTLSGVVAHNELSHETVVIKNFPEANFNNNPCGMLWEGHHTLLIKLHLEEHYNLKTNTGLVDEALEVAAKRNSFHPFRDYLKNLTWDGQARLDTVLINQWKCDDNAYTRAVSSKWVMAAVARCFKPGSKFDHVLILEGAQGIGKSSFGKNLLPNPSWFTDNLGDITKKEAQENIQGMLIVEMGELTSLKGNSAETAKAFISRTEDRYRPAYAKRAQNFPRQCIFIGTTNQTNYLKDESGNRRFWPVSIKESKNLDPESKLKLDRDQIWAEAVTRYKAGESLTLEGEAKQIAQIQQFERMTETPFVEEITEILNNPATLQKIYNPLNNENDVGEWYFPGGVTETGPDGNLYLTGITSKGLKLAIPMLKDASTKSGGKNIISNAIGRIPGWSRAEKKQRFFYGEKTSRGKLKTSDPEFWYERISPLPNENLGRMD